MSDIVLASRSETIDRITNTLLGERTDVRIVRAQSPEFWEALPHAKCVIGNPDLTKDSRFYSSASRLALIQLVSAGYDGINIEGARKAGVLIATNGGANSTAVAEHTLLLMLALSRRLIWQHGNVVAGKWWGGGDMAALPIFELRDKTLGIVGIGTIGKRVAHLARAFGMRVYYYDTVRLSEAEEGNLQVEFRLLEEVLRISDIVSLHLPLTDTTRDFIGADELKQMKPTSFLINTGRGPLIDEKALFEALSRKVIAGAGLDVFCQEPPAHDTPLFKLDNVILTPHLAGPTRESWLKRLRNSLDNADRMVRGERPLWIIPELQQREGPTSARIAGA